MNATVANAMKTKIPSSAKFETIAARPGAVPLFSVSSLTVTPLSQPQ